MVGRQRAVLVVGSDAELAKVVETAASGNAVEISYVETGRDALDRLAKDPFDVLVTDLDLPDMAGSQLVAEVRRQWPEIVSIAVAAETRVSSIVETMRAGADDVLPKPVDPDAMARVLGDAMTRARHAADLPPPSATLDGRPAFVGQSPPLRKALESVRKAAADTATVLIRGETGTGKELVARMVHDLSPRRQGPFVKVQCSALPDTLLESELFGYEKGAFTGANARKPGRVELAEGGTLFLDEIGDIALPMQGKLLRVLQDRQYERLGGTKPLDVDVRFVAATFRDLESMVKTEQFRSDLFYRLNVVTVWLPPLRARRDDIPELAQHFARWFSTMHAGGLRQFEPDALEALRGARWPGNVRQLENLVHRLVVLGEGAGLTRHAVESELAAVTSFDTQTAAPRGDLPSTSVVGPLDEEVSKAERRALVRALERTKGNRTLAARLLGISRRTLYNKLAEHGLD
jgi:DNA-binding NtrC family response regulator